MVAARPTLATRPGATLTYLSSPAGTRGAFYRAWEWEGPDWERTTVTAAECPRITPAFLSREREALGPLYAQEYECQFLTAPGGVIDPEALEAAFARASLPELPFAPRPALKAEVW